MEAVGFDWKIRTLKISRDFADSDDLNMHQKTENKVIYYFWNLGVLIWSEVGCTGVTAVAGEGR